MKRRIALLLTMVMTLTLCWPAMVSAATTYQKPLPDASYTMGQLAGTWSGSREYTFGRITWPKSVINESLVLNSDGSFTYKCTDSGSAGNNYSDSGTYSVSGTKLSFTSGDILNGTHDIEAYMNGDKDYLTSTKFAVSTLSRGTKNNIPAYYKLTKKYKVQMGNLYLTTDASVYKSNNSMYYASLNVCDLNLKNVAPSAVNGISAKLLRPGKSDASCTISNFTSGGELWWVNIYVDDPAISEAEIRYIEVKFGNLYCLLDVQSGFITSLPGGGNGDNGNNNNDNGDDNNDNGDNATKLSAKSVTLVQSRLNLVKGKSVTMPAVVKTSTGAKMGVKWSSSDAKKVSVSAKGVIKGVKPGRATITCKSSDGKKKAAVTVYVVAKPVKVKSVSISGVPKTMKKGQTLRLKGAFSASTATGALLKWSSSQKSVISVDAVGNIKALKAGKAKLTLKAGAKSKSVTLTVK